MDYQMCKNAMGFEVLEMEVHTVVDGKESIKYISTGDTVKVFLNWMYKKYGEKYPGAYLYAVIRMFLHGLKIE